MVFRGGTGSKRPGPRAETDPRMFQAVLAKKSVAGSVVEVNSTSLELRSFGA
jgi:hypothetical protein